MNKKQIIQEMFSLIEFSLESLVQYAEKNEGFMGDEGAYGLSYPHDIDDYEVKFEGRKKIPEGTVEVHYWSGEEDSIVIPLKEYIEELKIYLSNKHEYELAKRIDKILLSL